MSGGVSATTAIEVVAVAGAAASAYGAMQSAHAQASSDKFNQQVANNNAAIATQNATYAANAGEEAAADQQQKNRAKIGGILANQGASGIDVNQDSAVDVRDSAAQLGQLDTETIRANAARKAYGYQVDSVSDTNQSNLDKYAASNAEKAGNINAAGSVLGAASKGFSNGTFDSFLNSKSLSSGAGIDPDSGLPSSGTWGA